MLNRSSKKDSANYFTYDDIPLKVYYQIIETKNLSLLCRKGKSKRLEARWEEIVKSVEKFNNSLWYFNHLDDLRDLRWIMAEYIIVKASLTLLLYKVDRKVIEELREKGYPIDTSSTEAYARTVYDRLRNVENLITKLNIKKSQMSLDKEEDQQQQRPSFDSVMAQLSMALGFIVPEDITLKRFNQYTKALNDKHKPKMVDEDGN